MLLTTYKFFRTESKSIELRTDYQVLTDKVCMLKTNDTSLTIKQFKFCFSFGNDIITNQI